jgi:uncharacterized protein (TIGR04255 family)
LKREYPVTETQQPLAPLAQQQFVNFGAPPIIFRPPYAFPRLWFVSPDNCSLVQFQGDRIVFNWRKSDKNTPYPSYRNVIKKFKSVVNKFNQFLLKNNLGSFNINALELTYVNHINRAHGYTTLENAKNIFRDFSYDACPDRFLSKLNELNVSSMFNLPNDDGELMVIIQHAIDRENGTDLLKADIIARKFFSDCNLAKTWEWFNLAHQWIVCGFTDITTEKAHEIWGRYK